MNQLVKNEPQNGNKSVLHSIYNPLHERTIALPGNSEKYIIYWTPHAALRAKFRLDGSDLINGAFLSKALFSIANYDHRLLDTHKGYICIRDFKSGMIDVIHISGNKIRVVTCGDVNHVYPRRGDYVINRHKDGRIQAHYWSVDKAI